MAGVAEWVIRRDTCKETERPRSPFLFPRARPPHAMASSCEQAGAVLGFVDDKLAAASGPGEGERSISHSLEYPCTARFRLRRLLAYLRRWHSHAEVYEAYAPSKPIFIAANTRVIFHVKDLVKKVKEGQWREAGYYVNRFAPFYESGYEARLLMMFLHDLMALGDFSNGHVMVASYLCDWFMSIYKIPMLDKYPCFATLVADVLFMRSDHARSRVAGYAVFKDVGDGDL
ncbi:hypothetical protein HU200_050803 [Digitaria exilis]|uniref:Uncharacterized protein n=1 Tax=Digitaria exilis TaxID=1010633 RepID=A0A835E5M3_9POAL|nr:hypothetical protein HU200_050803 [Digitaria exilis]